MLRACFSAYYWVHMLHIWGSLGVIVVFVVIYRPWDLGKKLKWANMSIWAVLSLCEILGFIRLRVVVETCRWNFEMFLQMDISSGRLLLKILILIFCTPLVVICAKMSQYEHLSSVVVMQNMDFFFQPKITFFWGVQKIDKKKSTFLPPYSHLLKIFWTMVISRFLVVST